jgi:hypothetical protein
LSADQPAETAHLEQQIKLSQDKSLASSTLNSFIQQPVQSIISTPQANQLDGSINLLPAPGAAWPREPQAELGNRRPAAIRIKINRKIISQSAAKTNKRNTLAPILGSNKLLLDTAVNHSYSMPKESLDKRGLSGCSEQVELVWP